MAKTERQKQQEMAQERGGYLYRYRCNDGEGFEAVAHTEAGAFRVLNAERPGIYGAYLDARPFNASDLRAYK